MFELIWWKIQVDGQKPLECMYHIEIHLILNFHQLKDCCFQQAIRIPSGAILLKKRQIIYFENYTKKLNNLKISKYC